MRALMFNAALLGAGISSSGNVSISDDTVDDSTISPTSSSAIYRLDNDGTIKNITSAGTVTSGSWLIGSTSYSNFEARFTLLSGALSSGTTGTWQVLSSNRLIEVARASLGMSAATVRVEIRDAASAVVRDTATVALSAEVTL